MTTRAARRRVLIVTPDYPPRVHGGVGPHVEDLVSGLADHGWRATIVAPGGARQEAEECDGSARVIRMPFHRRAADGEPELRSEALYEVCRRVIDAEGSDLVHLHDPLYSPLLERLRAGMSLPLVLTCHSCLTAILDRRNVDGTAAPEDLSTSSIRRGERRSLLLADAVIAVSEVLAAELRGSCGATAPLHVVPNGIDLRRLADVDSAEVSSLRARLLGEGESLVLFAGRSHGVKGLPELLIAASLVRAESPGTRFVLLLCGTGPEVVNPLRELGLVSGGIEFLAGVPRSMMPLYLAAADVVAMPSRWEPFGLVALEAMAATRPLVVSDVPPLGRFVAESAAGLVVPRSGARGVVDARRLAHALLRLVRTAPGERAAMGERGRRYVRLRYPKERMIAGTIAIYRRLVAEGRRQRRPLVAEKPSCEILNESLACTGPEVACHDLA